ncbi:DUF6896 domain-containing protein [Acaryochloris marina]|nr:hypothetical protein [Acaryochloris marina]BDM81436.1 hypothetical protein AM10699_43030 [Acaryochloris marina MBIC10699]
MDKALDELILSYVKCAESLFCRVASHLQLSLPISNRDWACLGIAQRGETEDGVKYFKHGYGVAMDDGSHYADLDLGDAGQTNGFDAWRLFDYAEQNKVDTPYKSVEEVEQAIKRAFQKDEIRFSGYILYYRIIRVV